MGTTGGRFVFDEAGQPAEHCPGGTVNSGVRLENNTDVVNLEVDGYQLNGGLVDSNNSGIWSEIEGNTVHGSGKCLGDNFMIGGTHPIDDEGGTNTYTGKDTGCPGGKP